ncbi:MAG: hypothetical protein PHF56_13115 [Desulfuromonadaceae bacterium]|nr:hypothetical protein [Desulfuromonadaceae bacterium]
MIIRNKQNNVLTQSAEDGYVASAVAHLKQYNPLLATSAGQSGLENLARKGLMDARRYGLAEGRSLQLYLELMMSLGIGFDNDPQFIWLHPFLQKMDGVGSVARARLLHFHATAYLDRAYGVNWEFGNAAIKRAVQINTDQLRVVGSGIGSRSMQLLHSIHPERMDFLDRYSLDSLMAQAVNEAMSARLPHPEGIGLLFLLKFAFGHEICSDPRHPWFVRILHEESGRSESERMEWLTARTRKYMETLLQQQMETS